MFPKLVLFGAGVALLCAQQPPISNADLRQASGGERARAGDTNGDGQRSGAGMGWVRRTCNPGRSQFLLLERQRARLRARRSAPRRQRCESGAGAARGTFARVVLMRFEPRVADKLRVFSSDCPLDAGGLPLYWLSNVKPGESVAMLTAWSGQQTENSQRNKRTDSAVHAIAMHAGPEAQAALIKFAEASQPEGTRRTALFWLANSRGKQGYEVVSKVAREDPSDKVREHAVFALTQSREAEAIPTIIRLAKEDKAPRVRSQALFWLSQKASKQASEAINEAIERDPDTEVKKKAVFALSQLPKDEGIPRLIQLARNNPNPVVRKQAMFWLGQSQDRRATEFFEQVLTSSR